MRLGVLSVIIECHSTLLDDVGWTYGSMSSLCCLERSCTDMQKKQYTMIQYLEVPSCCFRMKYDTFTVLVLELLFVYTVLRR